MRTAFLAATLVFLLTGCSTQASLTVRSQPAGAYITEVGTGTSYGIAPATIHYDPAALARTKTADGCFLVRGLEAHWVSGVVTSLDTIRLCGSTTGYYNITYNRDPAQPGLDQDLQFALQVPQPESWASRWARARTESKEAEAARRAAIIHCTSTQIGSIVHTTCN